MLKSLDIAMKEDKASKKVYLLIRWGDHEMQTLLAKFRGRKITSTSKRSRFSHCKFSSEQFPLPLHPMDLCPSEVWALNIVVRQRAKTTDDLNSLPSGLRFQDLSTSSQTGKEVLWSCSCQTLRSFSWSPEPELKREYCRHIICRHAVKRSFWIEQRRAYFNRRPSVFQPFPEAELLNTMKARVGSARAEKLVRAAELFFTKRHGI